jgi:hypothetical protein
MVNKNIEANQTLYYVVHPLDDLPEKKRSIDGLAPVSLNRGTRWALMALRVYVIAMGLLIAHHAMAMSHIVR